jgi:hypothetical protein
MPDALQYLVPPPGYFYRWSDHGDVVVWQDGDTLAFQAELADVLHALGDAALPPFGALLLTLTATRTDCGPSALNARLCEAVCRGAADTPRQRALAAAVLKLRAVTALPPELRRDSAARARIVRTLFDAHCPPNALPARALLQALRSELVADAFVRLRPERSLREVFTADMNALAQALRDVDEDTFAQRIQTGLDVAPAPATDEPDERRSQIIEAELGRMTEIDAQRGIAQLVPSLRAVMQLPRPLQAPDEMPLGGVSDISCRGSLDRLLLSELAQDDDILSARLANNEALYLRREIPPRLAAGERVVALDSGLRMWGLPRVFGIAVALAAQLRTADDIQVACRTVVDGQFVPQPLRTVEEITGCLAVLEPHDDPVEALAALAASGALEGCLDVLLITHADVFAMPQVLSRLRAAAIESLFIATVDAAGAFGLYSFSAEGGVRQLKRASFDLAGLMSKPQAKRLSRPVLDGLPAFFAEQPAPLKRAVNPCRHQALNPDLGIVGVDHHRCLLYWPPDAAGAAVELSDRVPPGEIHGIVFDASVPMVYLLVGKEPLLMSANLTTYEVDKVALARPLRPLRIGVLADVLFVRHDVRVSAFSTDTGEELGTVLVPGRAGTIDSDGRLWADGTLYTPAFIDGMKLVPDAEKLHLSPWAERDIASEPLRRLRDAASMRAPVAKHFSAVAVVGDSLLLLSKGGNYWMLVCRMGISWEQVAHPQTHLDWHDFSEPLPVPGREGRRYQLREATFRDGSRVVLDSRGCVHLQPANAGVQEMSILTTQGATAVWLADGRSAGAAAYRFADQTADLQGVQAHLARFAASAASRAPAEDLETAAPVEAGLLLPAAED